MINLLLAFALQARADDLVKVTSIVQYVEGHAQKTEVSGVKTDLVYQTPLYEGDRVDSNGVLKLTTRNGCVFVLRGDGALAAPVAAKPWRMRAESLRLICSGRATPETFGIANQPLVLKDGEVLFANKQVMLVNGSATYLGKPLELRKLYSADGTLISPQPGEAELRAFHLAEAPPRESYQWPEPPKPDKVYTSRLMLGPIGGGMGVSYDNSDYNQSGIDTSGARIQLHLKTTSDTATIFAFSFRSTDNHHDGPYDGANNSLDTLLLEVGHRNRFDRWWSPFWRLGAGVTQAKIFDSFPLSGGGYSSSGYKYEFYVLSASYGLDARVTPHFLRPFGLFVSAEGQVLQSVTRGARRNEQTNYQSGTQPAEPWRLTAFGVVVNAGLEAQF